MRTADDVLKSILEVRGGTLAEFQDRHNQDPRVVRSRLLAVPLLGEHWGSKKDDRILSKLNCSPAFVELAYKMDGEDAEFQKQLDEIGKRTTAKELTPSAQVPGNAPKKGGDADESPEALLFRIAREHYGMERERLLGHKNQRESAVVRRLLALIAKLHFSMSSGQISRLLGCGQDTAEKMIREVSYDYLYDKNFRMVVGFVCKEFDISLDRKESTTA